MRLKSFLQFFTRGWRKHRPISNKPFRNRSTRLLVEMLEQRELLPQLKSSVHSSAVSIALDAEVLETLAQARMLA